MGPGARAVVLGSTAELVRDSGPDGSWIGSRFERDGCFVNVGDALRCQRSSGPDLMVVGQLAACGRAGVKGRVVRRRRVARLGRSVDLLVVSVFFELDVEVDLLFAFDAVGHAGSVPIDRRRETRRQYPDTLRSRSCTARCGRAGSASACLRTIRDVALRASLDCGSYDWNAALEALALFVAFSVGKVHAEVGKLDALCDCSDLSRSRTDPSDERLIFLLGPARECLDGFQDRDFNARFCEVVTRPISVFENVVKDSRGQLRHCRLRAKCLRNVQRVPQEKLVRTVSTTILKRQRRDVNGVDERVRSCQGGFSLQASTYSTGRSAPVPAEMRDSLRRPRARATGRIRPVLSTSGLVQSRRKRASQSARRSRQSRRSRRSRSGLQRSRLRRPKSDQLPTCPSYRLPLLSNRETRTLNVTHETSRLASFTARCRWADAGPRAGAQVVADREAAEGSEMAAHPVAAGRGWAPEPGRVREAQAWGQDGQDRANQCWDRSCPEHARSRAEGNDHKRRRVVQAWLEDRP